MARTHALMLLSLVPLLVPSAAGAQDTTCPTTDCASPSPCSFGGSPPVRNRRTVTYHEREVVGTCNPNGTCNDPRADCNNNNRCIVHLKGDIWIPDGPGPFPAFILNHGSIGCPADQPNCSHNPLVYYGETEKYFLDKGYVVFAPSRRGYFPSTGIYISDLIARQVANGADCTTIIGEQDCGTMDLYNEASDVIDAWEWLRHQPYVDQDRMAVFGQSLGGIVTTFFGMGGFIGAHRVSIAQSPASESWCASPVLRDMLMFAADNQFVPMYMFDTLNDVSIRPVPMLGQEMGLTGHIYQTGMFAKVVEGGNILTCGADAHVCFAFDPDYVARWAPTVLQFMHRFGVK